MARDVAFHSGRNPGLDEISKRCVFGRAAQSTCFPPEQIVSNSTLARLSEDKPWFPRRPRHNRNLTVLLVRSLRSIPAPQSFHDSRNLAAQLKSGFQEFSDDEVEQKVLRRKDNM